MKKRVLKHDLEFMIVVALLAFLFTILNSYNVHTFLSVGIVSALFLGYITYSGYKLFSILE